MQDLTNYGYSPGNAGFKSIDLKQDYFPKYENQQKQVHWSN
jgi:hypothetical protein